MNLIQKVFAIAMQSDGLCISLGDQARIVHLFQQCKVATDDHSANGPTDANCNMMRNVVDSFDKQWLLNYYCPLRRDEKLAKGMFYNIYNELHAAPPKIGVYNIGI